MWQTPIEIEEQFSSEAGSYAVKAGGETYEIYGPNVEGSESEAWGRATYAFFNIINKQITSSSVRFYAINNGNDLGGLFINPALVESSKNTIRNLKNCPYIPEPTSPWYGQFH